MERLLSPSRLLVTQPEDIPAEKGAYILQIDLPEARTLAIKRFEGTILAAGRYYYCGSANGGGGLAARVGRHFKAEKPIRWHVDHLTVGGTVTAALIVPRGTECDLVRELIAFYRAEAPVMHFGASDCRLCDAHLLHIPPDRDPD